MSTPAPSTPPDDERADEERADSEQTGVDPDLGIALDDRAQLLVDSLDPDELAQLATAVAAVRSTQRAALEMLVGGVVTAMPRPLRGRVRSMLGLR